MKLEGVVVLGFVFRIEEEYLMNEIGLYTHNMVSIETQNVRAKATEGEEITWDIIKEGLKQVPIIGNIISVAESYENRRQLNNISEGLKYLETNLEFLSRQVEKIDVKFTNLENIEFSIIAKKCIEDMRDQYQKEKIKLLANFMANICTIEYSKLPYKEGLLEKISSLSYEHILLLNYFYESYEEAENEELRSRNIEHGIKKEQINRMFEDKMLSKVCLYDLKKEGFIEEITGAFLDYSGGAYYITDYGILCIEILKDIN